jgi:hypothetical protein
MSTMRRAARSMRVAGTADRGTFHVFERKPATAGGSSPGMSIDAGAGSGRRGRVAMARIASTTKYPASAMSASTPRVTAVGVQSAAPSMRPQPSLAATTTQGSDRWDSFEEPLAW